MVAHGTSRRCAPQKRGVGAAVLCGQDVRSNPSRAWDQTWAQILWAKRQAKPFNRTQKIGTRLGTEQMVQKNMALLQAKIRYGLNIEHHLVVSSNPSSEAKFSI